MPDRDDRIPIHHPRTAARVFSGEAVIISPAEHMIRMLNPVGSRIWELADGTRTVDAIAAILAAEYEVEPAHAPKHPGFCCGPGSQIAVELELSHGNDRPFCLVAHPRRSQRPRLRRVRSRRWPRGRLRRAAGSSARYACAFQRPVGADAHLQPRLYHVLQRAAVRARADHSRVPGHPGAAGRGRRLASDPDRRRDSDPPRFLHDCRTRAIWALRST